MAPRRLVLLAVPLILGTGGPTAAATVATAAATGAQSLGGGPTTVNLPIDQHPGFSFKNETGIPICDLIIAVTAGSMNLSGAHVSDPNQAGEDWDVDDNTNNAIDPAENTAAPGAGGEGAGGAALTHPDNTLPTPGRSVRTQETDYDNCVRPGRTFSVTLSFDGVPNAGDTVSVQPTNERGANIYSFTDGLLGLAEIWQLIPGFHLVPAFGAFGVAPGAVIESLTLEIEGALPLWVESQPSSLVEYSLAPGGVDGDVSTVTLTFLPPANGDDGITLDGELDGFGTITVSGQGYEVANPDPIATQAAQAAAAASGPISLPGTSGNSPTEVSLPHDQQPALTFKNDTGVEICDLILGVKTGNAQLTGGLLDDANQASEDWDVDDDRSGELDAGENTAAPAAEGSGPAGLGHRDNTQTANRRMRLQEAGWDDCIRVNGNFGVTLSFNVAPEEGDKLTVQPTNDVGANIYAFTDGLLGLAEFWTLDPTVQLNTTFAGRGTVIGGTATSLTLTTDDGTTILWVETDVPAEIVYWGSSVDVVFAAPLEEGDSVLVQGQLSDFGTLTVEGRGATVVPVLPDEPTTLNQTGVSR